MRISRTLKALAATGALTAAILVSSAATTQTASAASCYGSLHRYGDRGDCVLYIQSLTNYQARHGVGRYLVQDGIFGSKTRDSIRRVQSYWRLRVDGIVGPQTWPALCNVGMGDINNLGWVPIAYPIWAAQGAGCPGSQFFHY